LTSCLPVPNLKEMKHVHIITYGCQMNEHDSEQIAGVLQTIGYTTTPDLAQADLILLNTCSIREKAEHKLYSRLGTLRELKRQRPELVIGVCGCVAQQDGADIFKHAPYVDFVLGTKAIPKLPALLQTLDYRSRAMDLAEYPWDNESEYIFRECRFKAYITIIRGCNNFCSYCVVPYTRGREESRSAAEIVREAEHLVQDGVVEITLLGQNVSSYADPTNGVSSFPQLLEAVHQVDGLHRIRFITAHPKDLSPDLVEMMARLPKVCEHFHLPAQAGSDRVLNLMNRRYTRAWYLSRVKLLREAMSDMAITTDIIVGFPGEEDADFQQTLSLLEEVRYDGIFAFNFSVRPNAKAGALPNHVPEALKNERLQRVLDLQKRINSEKHALLVGKTVEVLPEELNPRFPDTLTGRTRTNHVITFPGNADFLGKFVTVEITTAHPFRLSGRLVPQ
jgi:tRNA-2-methylthio-N6-dimethylallyladenosine synthase